MSERAASAGAASRPRTQRVTFQNESGEALAARLDLPPYDVGAGVPVAWCVFAHCFTCSKDFPAASRISRGLAARGFGVLRFDFTGLGSSDGDFANTNFSSNVDDLVRAAEFLAEEHGRPALLVGHSLGGAAVLSAAPRIEGIEAVVSIAAPADPLHVKQHFEADLAEIESTGKARVHLGGREFTIKRQFLEDLEQHESAASLGDLDAALLVMHGPLDRTVPISEARRIYDAARGYKSFVTLGDADHLISRKEDADYVADVISAWAARYVELDESGDHVPVRPDRGDARVEEIAPPFTNRVATHVHDLIADEPAKVGGADLGPAPFELLSAALGACTSMTVRMYADRKEWPLTRVSVDVHHERVKAPEDPKRITEHFDRRITLEGELSDEQRARLLEIADRCPVHRALENEKRMTSRLE